MTNDFMNNRWIRLVKDVVFVLLGLWIMARTRFFFALLGAATAIWYGRDAWLQAKALWQEKTYRPQKEVKKTADNGKISLSPDAKEVDFEKE